jgi:DNA-binding response OmpR family regulator
MSPPMSTEAENTQATGGSFPRPTVLVIDDEPLIRWSLGEAIREAGYAVRAAATGADAKAVLATLAGQPLVIVLDLRLPDVVDLSLLRTLRSERPDAPVLVLSAWASSETAATAAMEAGAVGVLKKPFDVGSVVAAVRVASGRATPAYTL